MLRRKKKKKERSAGQGLPEVEFTAMGAPDDQKDQGNLLKAKQSEAFPLAGELIAHALAMRGGAMGDEARAPYYWAAFVAYGPLP